ncbi:MAG TPA: TlyA family RNA methyltransferase [Thermoanaerobaculia bacterium]|nr:TlyA family RNA methyltransferase [Thermoanaerobaculia bacterium]
MASRLDQLLVERGLFPSREQARRAVMAGLISVDGRRVDKPGTAVGGAAALAVAAREPFVSRAGRKLAHALDHFGIDPAGRVCLDVGASTGGFSHCLLERGARRVYALDVGHGQLDQRLRRDPRVVVMEGVNARYLAAGDLPEPADLITVDVSFISLAKVVPALLPHLRAADLGAAGAPGAPGAAGGDLLVLIKPQFEAGRGAVGKGGILRDEALRRQVIAETAGRLAALGGLELAGGGWFDSPVAGSGGNREAFALLRRRES